MSIVGRAKVELDAINFGDEDSAVMIEIMEKFFDQWDSGGAVSVAVPVLMRLLNGMPLSPLTGADAEWIDRSEYGGPCWQNIRRSSVFKQNGKCTDIDNPKWDGSFPYYPPTSLPLPPVMEIET
jgi:hypothetical protein